MNKIILVLSLLLLPFTSIYAAENATVDPKYCTMYKQLHKNMNIGDVFLIMGPPRTFGQPPNLDIKNVNSNKANIQQPTITNNDPQAARQRVLASIANDPILGAFIKAPPDYNNVLIWQFDGDLSVSIKVKGPIVTDVKANFSCT